MRGGIKKNFRPVDRHEIVKLQRTGKAETAGCQNSIQKLLDLSFHFAGII